MLVREGAGSGGLPGLDCPPWPRESPRRPARATDPRGPGDSQYPGGRSSHSWQDKHISELSLGIRSQTEGIYSQSDQQQDNREDNNQILQAHNLNVLNVQDGDRSHSRCCYQSSVGIKTLYQT